jgi:hypothetical protein
LWYCVLLRLLSSHLAIIVLTLNKVFVAILLSFHRITYSPPPLGALNIGNKLVDLHVSGPSARERGLLVPFLMSYQNMRPSRHMLRKS